MQILMTAGDPPGTKRKYKPTYNPIPKTKMLLMTMAEMDPGLTLTSIGSKNKLLIAKETFPKTKKCLRNS